MLIAVMQFESNLDPQAVNKVSGATGLIQFMPRTAGILGTTLPAIKAMSFASQLALVEKYLRPYAGRIRTVNDLYMAVLWPVAVDKPDSFVLFAQGDTHGKAYVQNRGLDINKDGTITKAEAAKRVNDIYRALSQRKG
jgi:hypothetical protein